MKKRTSEESIAEEILLVMEDLEETYKRLGRLQVQAVDLAYARSHDRTGHKEYPDCG